MIHLGITGHQALPAAASARVRERLHEVLAAYSDPIVGVSSLAEGADQLFARMLLQYGHRLHVIIPCADYEAAFAREAARVTYRRLLGSARAFEVMPFVEPSENAFWAAGQRVVELSDRLIAVWDGLPAKGFGGTAEVVSYAYDRGLPVEVIWPEGVMR